MIGRKTRQIPSRVVVARNDRLGDFILALPCFQLLRRHLPDTELYAYLAEYTREIAEMCPAIDRVVLDPKLVDRAVHGPKLDREITIRQVSHEWREERFDALLSLRSQWDVAWPGYHARIPVRVGPLTNLYGILFTHRLRQARSRSVKSEWQYNLDLACYLLRLYGIDAEPTVDRPVIRLDPDRVSEQRNRLRDGYGLDIARPLVFVHPGQSGTSGNLSVEQYVRLVRGLQSPRGYSLVITAGPGEAGLAQQVSAGLSGIEHCVFESNEGIRPFAELVANADVFIASSTGPLHVAGALDRPSAGFYEPRKTRGPLRWQTLNSAERRLGFHLPYAAGESVLEEAARLISERFLGQESTAGA